MRCFANGLNSWGWYQTRMFSVWNYLPFVSFTNTGQPYRNNTLKTEVQSPLCMEQFMLQDNSCYSCTELLLVERFCVKNGFSFCLKTTYPSPQIYLLELECNFFSFSLIWDKENGTNWKPNQQGQRRTISQGDLGTTRCLHKTIVYLDINICN